LQEYVGSEVLLGSRHDHEGSLETPLLPTRPRSTSDDVGNLRRKAHDDLSVIVRRGSGERSRRKTEERGGAQNGLEHEGPPCLQF